MMDWDMAVKVLGEAGYEVEQVEADRWRVRLVGQQESETTVRAAILLALAQSLLRATSR